MTNVKRFKHFVNEDLSDDEQQELSGMGFGEGRGQQWEAILGQIEELAGELEGLLDEPNDEAEIAISSLSMAISELREVEID